MLKCNFAPFGLKRDKIKNLCEQAYTFLHKNKPALFRRELQIAYSVVSVKKMLFFAITLCRNCYCEIKKAFLHLLETHIVFIGGYLLGKYFRPSLSALLFHRTVPPF